MSTGVIGGGNLDADLEGTAAVIAAEERQARDNSRLHQEAKSRGRLVKLAVIAVLVLVGVALVLVRQNALSHQSAENAADASDRFPTTPVPLAGLDANSSALHVQNSQSLSVNGQLNVNNSLVIAPTTRPNGAVTGQLYYDQTTNQLSYFNGSNFQTILSGTLPTTVGSLDGSTGSLNTGGGLDVSGQTLRNTGVLTLQGESGNVTLAAGPGIVVDGTTLSNSGILSLGGQGGDILLGTGLSLNGKTLNAATSNVNNISGAGAISVTNDGSGNYTIGLSALPGSGTVTSSGTATTGTIAMFTGVQNIEQSIISESGSTITVGGNLDVTGTITLNSPLSVAQGGTGVGTLPTNNVLVGNGTSAISGITGSNGQVLIINGAGAPAFASFSGDVKVSGAGATTIQPDAVALGTDTTGNYVANIGATTGLTVGNNTGEGSAPTLSVSYGSTAGTAVQGSTQLTCPSGTGNLNGGGTVITLGTGGTCGSLNTINNPTFNTSVTTPLLQGAGLSVNSTGANSLTFGTNSSTRLTIDSTGNLTATGNLALQGSSLGVGSATQGGSLVLNDGSSNTGTLEVSALAQNVVYTLPDPGSGSATICLDSGNCAGSGGGVTASGTKTTNALTKFTGTGNAVTSSTITDNGTVVTTTVGLNVQGGTVTIGTSGQLGSLTLNSGTGQTTTLEAGASASNLSFILPTTAGSSDDCLQKGTGNQLVWGNCTGAGGAGSVTSVDGMNGDLTVLGTSKQVTVTDNSGTGDITLSLPQNIDVAAAPQFGQLTVQSDQPTGDMLTVNNTDTGAPTGNLINLKLNGISKLSVSSAGNVLGGTYNGQTIGATSHFTGDMTVDGALTVNTISPSSALTVGVGGQAFTLQGNTSSAIKATNGSFTTSIAFQNPTANVTYQFAAASAGGSPYDICTTAGNCVGTGGSVAVTGTHTQFFLPMFSNGGASSLSNSILSQDSGATTLTVNGNLTVTGSTTLDTPLSVTNGGTGLTSVAGNELLLANSGGTSLTQLANGSDGDCLVMESGVPVFDSCTGAGGVSSINTKSGAVTLNGTTNQISITNPSGSAFNFSLPQDVDTGADITFNTLDATAGLSTGGTQRIDGSGNLASIGSITASGTIQGGGLTIDNGGTITLNNLTGGASTCLTLNASHVVGTATCSTGTGTTPTLQDVYNNSGSVPGPIINLNSTGKGVFIQDASTSVGGNLFAVQNSTGSTKYLAVSTTGASITGTLAVSSTINTTGGYLLNGSNINTVGTLGDVAYFDSPSINFTGNTLQHKGNDICDNSNNCGYLTGSAANGSYVQLAPGTVQASSSNNSLIFLNDTGTGNLLQLQQGGADKFVVSNTGNVTGGTYNTDTVNSSALTFSSASGTIGATGTNNSMTIQSAGTGTLALQAGAGGTVNLATAANAIVNLATGTTTSNISVATGLTTGTLTVGGTATTGAIIIGQYTGAFTSTVSIGAGATTGTQTVNIGTGSTGAGKDVVTVGGANGASTTTIQGGTGGLWLVTGNSSSSSTGSIFIQSGDVTSGTSSAGNVSIDTGNSLASGNTTINTYSFESGSTNNFSSPFGANVASIAFGSAKDGSSVLAVTETALNSGDWGIEQAFSSKFSASPGLQYKFSAWVRAVSLPQAISGKIRWETAGNGALTTISLSTVTDTTTGWTQITGSAVAPAGTGGGSFAFTNSGDGNGSSVTYFDDITVVAQGGAPSLLLGSSNAQAINIGSGNQSWATTIQNGSGDIDLNTGAGAISLTTGTGSTGVKVQTNSNTATAFQVQNSSGFDVLTTNTSTNQVILGSSSHVNGSLAFADSADNDTIVFSTSTGGVLTTTATGDSTGSFGAPSVGNYSPLDTSDTHNQIDCSLFTFASRQNATLTSMTVYTGTGASGINQAYDLAIYTGDSNQPTTKVATATGTLSPTAGANTLSISASLTAGAQYWLCANTQNTSAQWLAEFDNQTPIWLDPGQTYGTWPSTVSGGSGISSEAVFDITASYTLAGTGSAVQTVSNTGQTTLQGVNGNGSAFRVQDTAGGNILNVSTGGGGTASGVTIGSGGLSMTGLSNPTGVTLVLSNGTSSVPASTPVDYYVDAVDAQGNHTETVDSSTPATWQITGTGTTKRTATISWNAVPGAVSYTVYFSENHSSTYYSHSVPAGTTSLVDTGSTFAAAMAVGAASTPFIDNSNVSGINLQSGMGITLDNNPFSGSLLSYTQYNQLLVANGHSNGSVTVRADNFVYENNENGDNGNPVFQITGAGATTLQTPTNSANAFMIQNSSGTVGLQVSTSSVVASASGTAAILKLGKTSAGVSIVAAGSITQGAGDYSEYFQQAVPNGVQPGEVVCLNSAALVEDCGKSSGDTLLGVVSTDPAIVGNNNLHDTLGDADTAIVSMLGQVPVKVSEANGPIHVGDMLTFDPATGLAVKATSASMTIGQALEDFSGTTGTINLYIHIGYYDPMGLQSDGVSSGYVVQNGDATLSNLTLSGTATIGTLNASTATIGTLTVSVALSTAGITINGHIVTGGGTPTVVAGATAGSGASLTVTGTDTSGKLTVTIGTGATAGDLADLTFHSSYSAAPNVTVTAGDSNAAQVQQYVMPTTTGFSLNAAGGTLTAGQTYIFYYHVIQ